MMILVLLIALNVYVTNTEKSVEFGAETMMQREDGKV